MFIWLDVNLHKSCMTRRAGGDTDTMDRHEPSIETLPADGTYAQICFVVCFEMSCEMFFSRKRAGTLDALEAGAGLYSRRFGHRERRPNT